MLFSANRRHFGVKYLPPHDHYNWSLDDLPIDNGECHLSPDIIPITISDTQGEFENAGFYNPASGLVGKVKISKFFNKTVYNSAIPAS